jgi:TonB family protein
MVPADSAKGLSMRNYFSPLSSSMSSGAWKVCDCDRSAQGRFGHLLRLNQVGLFVSQFSKGAPMRVLKVLFAMLLVTAGTSFAQIQHNPSSANAHRAPSAKAAANTHYYGAVDLGSRGTKASLYSFVTEEEGANPDVIFSRIINTSLVSSMQDGNFSPAGITDAVNAVQQVVEAMQGEAAKRDIDVDVYYVVGSSGVARAKNKQALADAVKAKTGIQMDFIDAGREGYYGLMSSAPRSRRMNSVYVDVGSGNTKLGCLVGDHDLLNYRGAEIIYGSTSMRNEALKRNPKDVNAGIEDAMQDVSSQYEAQSRDIPCLRNRQRIYWTGGAAWATATFMHPEAELKGWVVLTRHDVDTFISRLKDGTWNQRKPVFAFPEGTAPEREKLIREKAQKEIEDVQNVFVREDLLSGVSIMKAILNSSNPAVTIRFARNGSFIYGYALEKYAEANPTDAQVSVSSGALPAKTEKSAPVAPPAASAKKVNISSGIAAGMLLQAIRPQYPAEARDKHIQGTVVVQVTISPEGSVEDTRAVSGPEVLVSSALDAVKMYHYRPYLLNNQPVTVQTTVNVAFQLSN